VNARPASSHTWLIGPARPPRRVAAPPMLAPVRWPPPAIRIALPTGGQAELPGLFWPALSVRAGSSHGSTPPPVAVVAISRRDADPLLERWHPLGACRRPFGRQDFALVVDGRPVAVMTSASTVSASICGDLGRRDVVELARLARDPGEPHALRAALRLWREWLAPAWAQRYWPVEAAVAYALPGTAGRGDLYRFDGWTRVRDCRPWAGGATWSGPSRANAIGDGIKSLWLWRYPPQMGSA
jgi:hypothetical protein